MFEWLRATLEQFRTNYWDRWTPTEKATFGGVGAVALIALVALIVAPFLGAGETAYETVAQNLDPADREDILLYLDERGIDYQLANNATEILVPADKTYRVRYAIGSGRVLRDGMPGFSIFTEPKIGITKDYFDQQKLHAMETELERTIRAGNPAVDNVFVHLNLPEQKLFIEDERPASASVKVLLRGPLEADNVDGIKNLVAFAVEGLEPNRVQVVDGKMRILAGKKELDPLEEMTDVQLKKTRELEDHLEQKGLAAIDRAVKNAVVKVNVDLDFNVTDRKSTTYDPDSVLRHEMTHEESTQRTAPGAVPGTAANVPGAEIPGTQGAIISSEISKSEVEYEISTIEEDSTIRDVKVNNMTVAVLVDSVTDEGTLVQLAGLVKNAVGYSEEEYGNDGFTIAGIPFDTSEEEMRRKLQQEQHTRSLVIAVTYGGVALLMLLAMAITIMVIYRKRRHMHEEMISRELEVLERMKREQEAREYTASELGIRDVGDISQLPEDEQRRIRLKQQVEEFAKSRSEDFAAILKSWLRE